MRPTANTFESRASVPIETLASEATQRILTRERRKKEDPTLSRLTCATMERALDAVLWLLDQKIDEWLGRIGFQLLVSSAPADGVFLTLATSLAAIASAFLGLYFTAISVVASTSYRDVPDDVRVAAVNERMGNSYLSMVSALAAIGITMSASLALGVNPGRLNFGLLGILGVSCIFSFVPLGRRAFSFLDPVRVADSLGARALEGAGLAASIRHHRNSLSFQAAYQRRAGQAVGTIESVVRVSIREAHSDSVSLSQLGRYVLRLTVAYESKKRAIPTDSLWFPRRAQYQSWLSASTTELDMALRNDIQIQPKAVADRYWVESRLIAVVCNIIENLFRQEKFVASMDVAEAALEVVEWLTYQHRFHEARILSRGLAQLTLETTTDQPEGQRLARRWASDMPRRSVIFMIIGLGRAADNCLLNDRPLAQTRVTRQTLLLWPP